MADIENKVPKKDVKKRMVKALYSYTPENIDELELKVNDILEVIEETEEGWWKGILDGNVGMFPSNFVIELDGLPEEFNNQFMNELSPTKNASKVKNVGHQEPLHRHGANHSPVNKQEKSANTQAINSNSEDVNDGLNYSKSAPDSNEKKIITINKKSLPDSPAPRLPPKPVREQAVVMFPYKALNEDELTLKEGDIITVISKEIEDKGWWKGELNNRVGVFPDNFVKLLKVEEQKKPERPDKPAVATKASLKSATSEKATSECSPKLDKKTTKTAPAKPPPPEIHKKEPERPLPPYPSKKPQLPHPMKKPSRSSLGIKLPSYLPPTTTSSVKSPVSENSQSSVTVPPTLDLKAEEGTKTNEKVSKSNEKHDKKISDELGFDAVESSGKKLVHLTANRVKAPNRRPPSHIFLKDNEKENGIATDPRRLSEPLLAEMKSLLPLVDTDTFKTNMPPSIEVKTKVPPSRPSPPNIINNNSSKQVAVAKESSNSEDSVIKAIETTKTSTSLDTSTNISRNEILQPRVQPSGSLFNPVPGPLTKGSHPPETELHDIKDSLKMVMGTMVSKSDYNELLKQVKELKEILETYNNNCNKAIIGLKSELEEEKKLRRAVETELQQIKERQTT
ncbi:SH3 domain-containing kinase-binding protein 1-like [Stegodyphus dumicola]|uniref:SH3 domain-containing kinase-binding protein 1-like n=1 Tax=Stegodyphus dumicola TaxID=202533 RepID=UPI0015B1815B|nr:SH3 domain-containing kinase-binding protein 1-like [Stegodyphus dumicola]XP_035207362.1 SH3 domain-containing kinase-binding protein 1-like [Stegodyphus dumicola]